MFNSFHATDLVWYPLKRSESQRLSDVFRGYRNQISGMKWVNVFLANVPILYSPKTPKKTKKYFLVFSGYIKWEHWPQMDQMFLVACKGFVIRTSVQWSRQWFQLETRLTHKFPSTIRHNLIIVITTLNKSMKNISLCDNLNCIRKQIWSVGTKFHDRFIWHSYNKDQERMVQVQRLNAFRNKG